MRDRHDNSDHIPTPYNSYNDHHQPTQPIATVNDGQAHDRNATLGDHADEAAETLNIQPEMGVYSALQHLNYKTWFALAEFVDNSIQSAVDNIHALRELHGADYRLKVDIEIDHTPGCERMVIRDNAGGIPRSQYSRAFRLASPPGNAGGLCEFGMGMKTAACWLSNTWEVRTSAMGEPHEGRVIFDVPAIVESGMVTLRPAFSPASAGSHFTEITLHRMRHSLSGGRTIGKIRLHLADIFRAFIRSGFLELTYDGARIEFKDLEPLVAPFYVKPNAQPEGPAITWQRSIDLSLSGGVRVSGTIGLLARGSTSRAGFALMRRDRLITGVDGETYRPEAVFGRSNSFAYQRLYGELTIEGVRVSHTKDSFALESIEAELIGALREVADHPDMPMLKQAANYRANTDRTPDRLDAATAAATGAVSEIASHPGACSFRDADQESGDGDAPAVHAGGSTDAASDAASVGASGSSESALAEATDGAAPRRPGACSRTESRSFLVDGEQWTVCIDLRDDPATGDWMSVSESSGAGSRSIDIVFGLAHPFVQRFATPESSELEPLVRMACAIGLAEVVARRAGVRYAGRIRATINQLLRDAMSNG